MRTVMKRIKLILLLCLLYVLITGIFIFRKPKKISDDYIENSSVEDYYSNDIGPDRGILMDNPLESGLARLKIIDSAKYTLNISYFSIEPDETSHLFFGALIDAADRGVEVNLLLDGIFHGLRGKLKPIIYTFINHPNMNLKFYEPLNPLKPWTFNNRMHDKYIIADNEIAIIGGRNIGDRYFAPEWYDDKITNDRDMIIINSKAEDSSSVIHQITNYFNEIWNHELSKLVDKNLTNRQYKQAISKFKELKRKSKKAKELNKDIFGESLDLVDISFPINKASFIHNPIGRFSKEPWCWYEITELLKSAERSIFIQSPYIIPHKQMIKGFLNKDEFDNIEITALTNSLCSTPNLPAYSGYIPYRKQLIDHGLNIYEYQSTDSLHTKSFIIDDDLLAVGSFNIDPRSAYLNTESMLIIHSPQAVKEIGEGLENYFEQSLLVSKDYEYIPNSNTPIAPTNTIKRLAIYALSYITRWFGFLL